MRHVQLNKSDTFNAMASGNFVITRTYQVIIDVQWW